MQDYDLRYKDCEIIVRTEQGKTFLEGVAVPFHDGSEGSQYRLGKHEVERFAPDAFDEWLSTNPEIEVRMNHDGQKVLAVTPTTARFWRDEKAMRYRAEIDPEISYHKDTLRLVQRGVMRGSSVKAGVVSSRWTREGQDEVRTITKAILFEASPVFDPAYKKSSVEVFQRSKQEWINTEATLQKIKAFEDKVKGFKN